MKLVEMMKQVNQRFGKGTLEKGLHQGIDEEGAATNSRSYVEFASGRSANEKEKTI